MTIFLTPLISSQNAKNWEGAIITVHRLSRSGLEVSIVPPSLLRIAINHQAYLWARIDEEYFGYTVLYSRQHNRMPILSPLEFALVRQARLPSARVNFWVRVFGEMLMQSKQPVLSDGRWFLGYTTKNRHLSLEQMGRILEQTAVCEVDWDHKEVDPIALRPFSNPEHGRVKAWRKVARDGGLPPLLLYWVSGLCAHVILDGHDRLLAAWLEQKPIEFIELQHVWENQIDPVIQTAVLRQLDSEKLSRADATDQINALLNRTFASDWTPTLSRARLLEGSVGQWMQEVEQELERQGQEDALLLSPIGRVPYLISPLRKG